MIERFKRWLAAKLVPELARDAEKYWWLKNQISYDARWLAEFDDVGKTLDRLIIRDQNHWRGLDQIANPADEWPDVSGFREMLRRRHKSREHQLRHDIALQLRHEAAQARAEKRAASKAAAKKGSKA